MITSEQSRAARALLNWSQPELASASGVSVSTIRDFETGKRAPIPANLGALRRALEAGGVLFIDQNGNGAGVRLRDRTPAPSLADKIADATERAGRPIPEGASPESGMAKLRRGKAQADLRNLNAKKKSE